VTPSQIRAAALAYNADYPEAADEIAVGDPELHVSAGYIGYDGYRLVSTYGIRTADGGFIAAEEPLVTDVRRRDKRESAVDAAEKLFRNSDGVPVRIQPTGA